MGEDIDDIYHSAGIIDSELANLLCDLTPEGRAQAILQLATKTSRRDVPEKYFTEAIKYFETKNVVDVRNAAIIAEHFGMLESAAINYSRVGDDKKSLDLAVKAIIRYEMGSEYQEAANFASQMKVWDKAALNYERAGMFKEAADASTRQGDNYKARLYNSLDALVNPL